MHQLWVQIFRKGRVIKFQWVCISIYTKTWATHWVHGLPCYSNPLAGYTPWKAILTCSLAGLSHIPIPAYLYLSSWYQSSIILYLMPSLSTAFKTMSWKFAHFTICHPDESVGSNIHSFSKYLWNIRGTAVAGLDGGAQQLWSPASGISSLVYGTFLNKVHTPYSIHWYMLLVISSQRSICIPLLILFVSRFVGA